jgi:parvulin-like peptidyl-prolyl isomerase
MTAKLEIGRKVRNLPAVHLPRSAMIRLRRAMFLSLLPAIALAAPAAEAPKKAPAAKPGAATAAPAPGTAPAAAAPAKPAESAPAPEVTYAFLKAPLFADEFATVPIAKVEDEVLTMQDLTDALAGVHASHGADAKAGKRDFTPVLERLIDARLLVVEAREMGIADLPEHKEAMEAFKESAAREMLQARATKDAKADPAVVKKLYEDTVREWKVKSLLVTEAADAKSLAAQKTVSAFDAAAAKLVADKKAKGSLEGEFLPRPKLLPEILATLETMKVGDVSAPIKLKDGYAVLRVEDVRYPEDAKARAQAEAQGRSLAVNAALSKYYAGLVKRYATINEQLLKKIDFEAKVPGIDALAKDKRVVATIKGAKPITVSDVTAELQGSYFHGVENATKEKKANRDKLKVFDGLLSRRIIPLEVQRLGLRDTTEFKRKVAAFENQALFSRFIEKAIIPELKLGEPEVKKYYDEHQKEFMYPAFYRLESLAFSNVKQAQAAIEKLRSGTDFKWLNANAEGQIKPAERKANVEGVIVETAMPKELVEALANVKKGDYRLYAGAENQFYAIHVLEVTPPAPQAFDEVKEGLGQRVFGEALGAAIKDWAGKLRKARDVQVYLTRIGS